MIHASDAGELALLPYRLSSAAHRAHYSAFLP